MQIGLGIGIPFIRNYISRAIQQFTPASLFANNEQGVWYDPSDFTTLFQDAAGTTPVTAVEQPVGLMLDKSGRGNHAIQSTSANRPTLSARYNLLTKTEQFDNAVWAKTGLNAFGSGSIANAITAPDGTLTADFICESSSSSGHGIYLDAINPINTYTFSVYVKAGTRRYFRFGTSSSASEYTCAIFDADPSAGVFTKTQNSGSTVGTFSRIALNNGWFKLSVTYNRVSGAIGSDSTIMLSDSATPTIGNYGDISYIGDGTSGAYIWGADLRVANDALNQPSYQRVNTSSDYDTVGFKPYLRFNGTNQWLQTNSIDFTNTAQMFVSAGVRKLSDAQAVIAELSADVNVNNRVFGLFTGFPVSTRYQFYSKGTLGGDANITITSPVTNVVSGIGNISGDQSILRVNGSQAAISTADQGTGNYGNYPLYIGARAGLSLWANIRFYGAVIAGKQASAAEITNTETFINQKTGAY